MTKKRTNQFGFSEDCQHCKGMGLPHCASFEDAFQDKYRPLLNCLCKPDPFFAGVLKAYRLSFEQH